MSASYWAPGRSRAVIERTIQNSLYFGAYLRGQQAGFGRAITDYATFAYLADIIVFPEFQRRGVGKAIVKAMVEHPELGGIRLMLLRTRDAHGLGYFDAKICRLESIDNPFGPKVRPLSPE